jgi:prolyl oligopeptidase
MRTNIFILCLLLAACGEGKRGNLSTHVKINYPAVEIVDSTNTYWGVTYKDPYRWLEGIKDSDVIKYFRQEANISDSIMNKISGRDKLITEWKKLDKSQPPSYYFPDKKNNRYFFQKRMPGEKVSKVYYREGIKGEEILLFDPLSYIKGKTLSVTQIISSYDGKKLIISYSEAGAEVSTIKVMDVDAKKFLPDSIYPTAGANSWTFDDKAFLYIWIKSADNMDPTARLNSKTKLHKIGDLVKNDIDFFSDASYPQLKIDASVYPIAFLSNDSRNYIFSYEASVQNEIKLNFAPISQFGSQKIQWKPLSNISDGLVKGFLVIGDKAFAASYKNAKNYKVIMTDLKNPDWNHATVISPERSTVLMSIANSKDFVFMTYSDGINQTLSKYDMVKGTTTEVKLPFEGTFYMGCLDTKTNDCLITISSWVKPSTEFFYDASSDKFLTSPFNQPAVYPDEYKNLVVEEVNVKGHDSVMIPLSIIHKKDLKKDGKNVCLIEGYGAYGISNTPYFSTRLNSLATRDVVVAIAHVRGGGEKGEDWYRAGYKTTKPNTWKDFISCVEYLVSHQYTSPDHLAGIGTSAGGVLISRSITERPDLFAAAICNVGCANAMRLEFSSNGPVNTPEFGTVKDSIECKALFEMDGMQHVVKGTNYPAVMCVAGWNDPRVVPWQPGKLAAALQNASSSGKPVLLKVNYDNGHFTEDVDVTFANFADQMAFAMWQCGHPQFQMKK